MQIRRSTEGTQGSAMIYMKNSQDLRIRTRELRGGEKDRKVIAKKVVQLKAESDGIYRRLLANEGFKGHTFVMLCLLRA